MTVTKTSISNMALDILDRAPLTDVDTDNTPESRWFVRNFDITRDAELRKHTWKFAIRRVSLDVDATAPEFDWKYRYQMPDDCLRILPLRYLGEFEGAQIPHEVEANSAGTRWILTDQTTPLLLRYVFQVTDVTKFDPLFVQALAAKLAMMMAHRSTGKTTMVQIGSGIYAQAIEDARRANAIEGTPERPYADDVIAARYA